MKRVVQPFDSGYLDNPGLCYLDSEEDRKSLKEYLEAKDFIKVEVEEHQASAGVDTDDDTDILDGDLWSNIRDWYINKYPFCPEFLDFGNQEEAAEYIKDHRGTMTDDDLVQWIPGYPDLSNLAPK